MQGVKGTSQIAPLGVEDGRLFWSLYQIACSFHFKSKTNGLEKKAHSHLEIYLGNKNGEKKSSTGLMLLPSLVNKDYFPFSKQLLDR